MNVPAPESSPALNTKRGTTGMNQPFIAQLEGQVLSRCREPWLQCSRCEPGLLSGPFFWLVSCTALQPKSCFLHRNVKTQSKQFRVSASVTIYPLQRGFDGGGMENSIVKTPALLITTSVLASVKDRSARVGLHPSHLLLVLRLREDGPHSDPTQILCTQLPKNGPVAAWATVWLRQVEIFARWREFPAWRGMGRCPSFLQCSPRGGGEAVIFCCQKRARQQGT